MRVQRNSTTTLPLPLPLPLPLALPLPLPPSPTNSQATITSVFTCQKTSHLWQHCLICLDYSDIICDISFPAFSGLCPSSCSLSLSLPLSHSLTHLLTTTITHLRQHTCTLWATSIRYRQTSLPLGKKRQSMAIRCLNSKATVSRVTTRRDWSMSLEASNHLLLDHTQNRLSTGSLIKSSSNNNNYYYYS
jgi:hypothetical protein